MLRKKNTCRWNFGLQSSDFQHLGSWSMGLIFLIYTEVFGHASSQVLSQDPGYLRLGYRSLLFPICRFGRFFPSTSHGTTLCAFPTHQIPAPHCQDSLQQDGRERQKFPLIPVDMWLCLALWILLSVWISSCVFFAEMTVFLFRWQPLQDQIDSSLKAADEKQH